MAQTNKKPQKTALRKTAVMPAVCFHPITYATYTKFCPRKCLLCGSFIEQTEANVPRVWCRGV